MTTAPVDTSLAVVLEERQIGCVYQPVVDLRTRHVVAYEALMRGPRGTSMESPVALLEAAASDTEFALIDRLAHLTALRALADHPDGAGQSLFLNIEPRGIGQPLPVDVDEAWQQARLDVLDRGVGVVIELTERALLDDPAAVLASVGLMRELGARIALDDVGATPESLALLPLVRPDIVKLDLRLVREHGSLDSARISNAVRAYAEESGAAVVAEGVETEADHDIALALGGTLGQGWLYGRPAPLPERLPAAQGISDVRASTPQTGETPYDVISAHRQVVRATKGVLLPLSHSLEDAARGLAIPPLVLGCFQQARYFTPKTAQRYAELAPDLPLIAALGAEMPSQPAPGVRGAALADQDVLTGEWNVIVLGAHYAAALVARERGDRDVAESARTFDYVVTHDRELVIAAAQTLMTRLQRT